MMIYMVKSRHGDLKIVDDNNHIYCLDRKYGGKTYWMCEMRNEKV